VHPRVRHFSVVESFLHQSDINLFHLHLSQQSV
jgi:hypothetical protein